jgi:hypothetical protein
MKAPPKGSKKINKWTGDMYKCSVIIKKRVEKREGERVRV